MARTTEHRIIDVYRVFRDGVYEFASPQIPTFYLASLREGLDATHQAIPSALTEIVEAQMGSRARVKLVRSFDAFNTGDGKNPSTVIHYSVELRAA